MTGPRWKVWLCKACAQELATGDSRWLDVGLREVSHNCPSCDARFKTHETALDLRPGHHATFAWGQDAQGRPSLEVYVEGWPVVIRPLVHHLERVTRGGVWQAVTEDGERLERLESTNGGPLDLLVTGIVNQRLNLLNTGEEGIDRKGLARKVGSLEPRPYFSWQALLGYSGPHELRLWLDGWEIDVGAHVGPLMQNPSDDADGDGGWGVLVADGLQERLSGMEGEAIGFHVQQLVNDRLGLLRRNSKQLTPRKRRKSRS